MPRTAKSICPVADTVSVIGNKWTVLIVRDLLTGTKRFSELQKSLDGISPRTLSSRLVALEKDCIIKKHVYREVPLHTDYTLTKEGKALASILDQMIKWSKKFRLK